MANRHELLKGLTPLILGLLVIVIVVVAIPSVQKYVGKASGQPANLVFDYDGVLGKMPAPWRNLAQGGEESGDMIASVIPEIKDVRPEYIRIDHIYDAYNVVSGNDGNLVFDWSRLDRAVDSILATGAKPMLSLSYMPLAISKGDMNSTPRNWEDWGKVTEETIKHFSGKNQRNIDGVIYEVWNEPDLFGNYKTYGDTNYLDMYAASSRAAMMVTNVDHFEIGGPATTGLYQNWLETLIKYVDKNKLRMDFVSWHRYSTDLEQFGKDVAQARSWASNIPALTDLKYYITEWGFDSNNNKGYDEKSGAIQLLAASRMMIGTVDRAFTFEIKDGPGTEKNWGRWGLLTNDKFGPPEKKPRYEALKLLNELWPNRMSVAGEGSWVKSVASSDDDGNLKILVVNYDPAGTHTESVPMTFENLPKQNFTITRQDFMGGSRSLKVATDSATWKTQEFFDANSAVMFTVEF
jgi:hypothetical protein